MPSTGKRWYHLTLGTYNSWPPGDPRGWRSFRHKKHSSGDYQHPPPEGEHLGLYRLAKETSRPAIRLSSEQSQRAGCAIVERLLEFDHRVLALAIDAVHCHVLAELPADQKDVKRIIGRIKRSVSLILSKQLPGQIWARGCGIRRVIDESHQRNVYDYIVRHRDIKAWVWTFRDDVRLEDGTADSN